MGNWHFFKDRGISLLQELEGSVLVHYPHQKGACESPFLTCWTDSQEIPNPNRHGWFTAPIKSQNPVIIQIILSNPQPVIRGKTMWGKCRKVLGFWLCFGFLLSFSKLMGSPPKMGEVLSPEVAQLPWCWCFRHFWNPQLETLTWVERIGFKWNILQRTCSRMKGAIREGRRNLLIKSETAQWPNSLRAQSKGDFLLIIF